MTRTGLLLRVLIFSLPGILLLLGGRWPTPRQPLPPPTGLADLVWAHIYPDTWGGLFACALLICVPGPSLHMGSEYLATITFWGTRPVNETPACVWRAAGYGVSAIVAIVVLTSWFS